VGCENIIQNALAQNSGPDLIVKILSKIETTKKKLSKI